MKKSLIVVLVLLSILVLSSIACVSSAADKGNGTPILDVKDINLSPGIIASQQNVGLWISGEGKVTATPDIVLLSLGVEVQKPMVADAQREAADSMAKVMKVIKDKGIADKDIQTQQYSITPVKQWVEKDNKEVILGYRVTNMVTAKIRKLDTTGSVIDSVVAAAGNDVRVDDISFSIDDPTPYYKQAREQAVQYAMEKAKQISNTSGIKLGKAIYISEQMNYFTPQVRNVMTLNAGMAPAPAPTSISGGQLDIIVDIQMVYDIR